MARGAGCDGSGTRSSARGRVYGIQTTAFSTAQADALDQRVRDFRQAKLNRIKDAVAPNYDWLPGSDLLNQWAATELHHVILEGISNGVPLIKEMMQEAFADAISTAGFEVQSSDRRNEPGTDFSVDRRTVSFKTEAETNIKPDKIRLAKFRSAAWVLGMTQQDIAFKAREQVRADLKDIDRLIVFRRLLDENELRFEVVEIPTRMLIAGIKAMKPEDFQRDNEDSVQWHADAYHKGELLFTLVYDSAPKISFRNIPMDRCTTHCVWHFPAWLADRESEQWDAIRAA